jgi:cobalt-zinc-cadmium resistance protein CzcA
MFDAIIRFSIKKKVFVGLTAAFLLIGGIIAMTTLPIDAVPDITNNQVQIVTVSPTLAPQEVEKLITMPIEIAMRNIMNVQEIRSVSRFGLSVVTVVFKESVPILDARQLISEQIQTISQDIPSELGRPEMMPITTGLGEIYQYVLKVDPKYKNKYDAMELRTIQDWIVKRQLSGIPGIVEINSFGGYLKQYEVAVDPDALFALNVTIGDVFEALSRNNQNTGGSYIEKRKHAYYIRSEGMITNINDIGKIVITTHNGIPIYIRDVAKVGFGAPKRFGAMTMDGKGECVGGIALMLKGANANVVTKELTARVDKVQKMLPAGVHIEPYLNRSQLVNRNISTVAHNLIEGAIIVFLVLIIFLGDVRAGAIVASVIPLAMLFAFIMMRFFGVTANLMSLGAVDFGIVVDGSIVILEGIMAYIYGKRLRGRTLTREEMDEEVQQGASKVIRSATFAVLIILTVFFPILTLTGIEGKYFTPMAETLIFCIIGALILSLTYVPMMASLFLKRKVSDKKSFADRFFSWLNRVYQRALSACMKNMKTKWTTVIVAFGAMLASLLLFTKLGAEFIPTLDEGDFAMQMTLPAGSSLSESIRLTNQAEKILTTKFHEVKHVVAKIGTAEVPTDPMAVEDADIMIIMQPMKEWTNASSRAEMVAKMKDALAPLANRAEINFSQPIQLRFNELMTGSKADIAVKLYGEDTQELANQAKKVAKLIKEKVPGAADVIVEQTMGLPQLVVKYDRDKIARYGLDIETLNKIVRTAYAGETSGVVFENERRFDLVVRMNKVADFNLNKLFIRTADGMTIPMTEVADVQLVSGPLQINRDETKRRIAIGVNVRDADVQQVVNNIQKVVNENIKLKPGYYFEYGGQFENLQNAIHTLTIVIPVALMLILLILFFAFRNFTYTFMVFSTIPLSLIGGILALWLRGLPFSISAGVGFIALFGVAVLNGLLMINRFNDLRKQSQYHMSTDKIIKAETPELLRPVVLTGLVASLGFVPMAIATSAGAEVQRPLATVVIGGLIVSTILTLIVLPILYNIVHSFFAWARPGKKFHIPFFAWLPLLLLIPGFMSAQQSVTLDEAVGIALKNNPRLKTAELAIQQAKASRGENFEAQPTSFNYQWGQINSDNKHDKQYNLEQNLGSLITPYYKNVLVNAKVKSGTYYRTMVEKEVTAEVKRAWAYYQYAANLCALYRDQEKMATDLRDIADRQFKAGEITLLEKNMMSTNASELHNKLFQAQEEEKMSLARFRWSCYADTPIQPADSSLSIFYAPKDSVGLSEAHLGYFNSQADVMKAMVNVEKSHFFPEISMGYTRQDILPLKNLNAWMVGVSFPIIFWPQSSKVKQAKIAAQSARLEADANIRNLSNKVTELQSSLRRYSESLNHYNASALKEAQQLLNSAKLQLQNNETSIADYILSVTTARDIQRNYIETVYQYNIAALEYELYK